jgi:hypothetical protein
VLTRAAISRRRLEEWQAQGVASIKGGERMSVVKQPQTLQTAL